MNKEFERAYKYNSGFKGYEDKVLITPGGQGTRAFARLSTPDTKRQMCLLWLLWVTFCRRTSYLCGLFSLGTILHGLCRPKFIVWRPTQDWLWVRVEIFLCLSLYSRARIQVQRQSTKDVLKSVDRSLNTLHFKNSATLLRRKYIL